MSKNTDIASGAINNKSAIQIKDENDLLAKLQYLLTSSNKKELKDYQENALRFVNKNQSILDDYLSVIAEYIG
jgi:3-deoxy-D-manno-octulosonic-acid transferase